MPTENARRFRESRDRLLDLANDYGRAVREFEWPRVDGEFNWAVDWFDQIARGNERPALRIVEEDGTDRHMTFREMSARSTQVASWLRSRGVQRGDRVLVMLGNQLELWETALALMKLGAPFVPSTTALGADEIADRMSRGQITHVIVNAADTAKFATIGGDFGRFAVGSSPGWTPYADAANHDASGFEPAPVLAADPLLIYFTSGTTHKPKMVVHSQISYPVGHLSTMYWIGLRPGDVHMAISAPGWAKHAWSLLFAPWNAEATIYIYNYSRFDPVSLIDHLSDAEVTTFCAPPTVWRMLIQSRRLRKPKALREVVSAGEPLNPEVIAHIRAEWNLTIRDGFGQTETTALVGNTPGSDVLPGAMGRPLPGVPLVLIDPLTGEQRDEGEICLDLSRHPLNLMTGYLDAPELNAEVTRGGWYHTGDVATRSPGGAITYIGRTDDVFKSSDFKVSPFEVESILLEHEAVAEAAVVPAPHETRLTTPKAYVVLAAGWAADADTALAIFRHAVARMPSHMRVRRIEFSDLPKTISGKIRRVELREREELAARGELEIVDWRMEHFADLGNGPGEHPRPAAPAEA